MARTKSSARNFIMGVFLQLTGAVTGFILRAVMLREVGLTSISLNGLFNEVLAMLSMAELGVGSAITYNLYKPLAQKDWQKVSQYMDLFKKAYRIIFSAILVLGAALLPFIQLIVKDAALDTGYIRLVYSFFVLQTASSYLFSYKTALIAADQKRYIESLVSSLTKILSLLVGIVVLKVTKNYIAYLASVIVVGLCQNFCYSIIADRMYPCLKVKAELGREEKRETFRNIKNLFIGKLSGKITNSTDNILISTLVSTISVGLYSNYALIINACKGLSDQFGYSVTASMGNLVVMEDLSRAERIVRYMTYIVFLIGLFVGVCLYTVISDVVTVWLGAQYVISGAVVLVCCVNFVLHAMRVPLWETTTATGLFSENSKISIVACLVNLVVSIAIGIGYGMVGIFIGTTCTYLLQICAKTYYLYQRRFMKSPAGYYTYFFGLFVLAVAALFLAGWLCSLIVMGSEWLTILCKLCVSFAVCVCVGVIPFMRTKAFKYCVNTAKRLLKRKERVAQKGVAV